MKDTVKVVVDISDLERVVWEFHYRINHGAWLDRWRHETRKTKRHKFRAYQFNKTEWVRMDRRDNLIPRPDVPDYVEKEALRLFRQTVCIA